jgi:hypothetical protein
MKKITREEFIAKSEEYLQRPLLPGEVKSIQKCECHLSYCTGWTAELLLPSLFEAHAWAGGVDIGQPVERLEL